MGKKNKEVKRVVLDTNILVSALLFKGEVSKIAGLWKKGKIIPVLSRETFDEFQTVLGYPKFKLTKEEITAIIKEEILPFFEVVESAKGFNGVCKDPDDDIFIACAVAASADIIVSGDKALCDLVRYKTIRILKALDFIMKLQD